MAGRLSNKLLSSRSAFVLSRFKVRSYVFNFPYMAAEARSQELDEKILLYPEKSRLISAFWRDKYEKDARKNWDIFYKRNANRFFKDRHYLDKEWGQYFEAKIFDADCVVDPEPGQTEQSLTILEVGCGTGNTVYPLIETYPHLYVYACDFSSRAVDLVKAHENYEEGRVKAFVCDVTSDSLCETITPASVDVITLIFVLSAIAPEKMAGVVCNLKSVLKPGGVVLLRDYAVGDLAQERLMVKEQQISDNFYVRGDGTRAFYFSEDSLKSLFVEEEFECKEMKVHCRQLENRSRKIVMDRRWIQSVFYLPKQPTLSSQREESISPSLCCRDLFQYCVNTSSLANLTMTDGTGKNLALPVTLVEDNSLNLNCQAEPIVDLSEGCAAELFGSAPLPELMEVAVGKYTVHAKCLPRENQHTHAATGFMLWESALALAELLEANPSVTRGKTVLELGCGSVGLCSLIASLNAEKLVATDGDAATLTLLQDNLELNKYNFTVDNISCEKLEWGNKQDIETLKAASNNQGFQLIIGTDVTYVRTAVPLLFETARTLLMEPNVGSPLPMVLLCHRIRLVAESDIISSAISQGFSVIGMWSADIPSKQNELEIIQRKYVETLFEKGLENVIANYNSLQLICLTPLIIK